ncbi:hypothetical protein CYMTET_30655 [Cymbomonas tetramitiformis]|uniref:F-box domain-containing protein n=1 Tax=Cymbomonas tetramitiformis TaxID=36881 RepID=A0AAE0KTQ9_9CHLO|nr:hypothetical protein CYMTET_30655 [Cymbomonas tetramitiformis]
MTGDDLPRNFVEAVLRRSLVRTAACAAAVCRTWYEISRSERLWKEYAQRDHGLNYIESHGERELIKASASCLESPRQWHRAYKKCHQRILRWRDGKCSVRTCTGGSSLITHIYMGKTESGESYALATVFNGEMHLWSLPSGNFLHNFPYHRMPVLQASTDQYNVFALFRDGACTLHILNQPKPTSSECKLRYTSFSAHVHSLPTASALQAGVAVVGTEHGEVHVWKLPESTETARNSWSMEQQMLTFSASGDYPVQSVGVDPSGSGYVLSISAGQVSVWNARAVTPHPIWVIGIGNGLLSYNPVGVSADAESLNYTLAATCMAVGPRRLAVGHSGGGVCVVDWRDVHGDCSECPESWCAWMESRMRS